MRTFATILLLLAFMLSTADAQDQETRIEYHYDGNSIVQEKVERTPLRELSTAQIDPTVIKSITDDQWDDIFAGQPVTITESEEEIPTKISYVIKTVSVETTTTLQITDGRFVAESFVNPPGKSSTDTELTFAWLILVAIITIAIAMKATSWQRFSVFALAIIASISISIIAGQLTGVITGMFIGAGVGVISGGFAGKYTDKYYAGTRLGFIGASVGMLTSAFSGIFAGKLTTLGLSTAVLWQYVLVYAIICLLALSIRELTQYIRNNRTVPEPAS